MVFRADFEPARVGNSYKFKTDKGGEWTHGIELISDLLTGRMSIYDEDLQKELLDWMLTDNKNVFVNKGTGDIVYALAAKRGNRAYASKKVAQLDNILESMKDREYDFPVKGRRDNQYRLTNILFFTITFSNSRFTPEEAWAMLRSSGIEGLDNEYGVLNNLGANISSIFGKNGKIVAKEANSKGYPAPHLIVILDKPVLVKRHVNREGKVSWRLDDERILARVGKDKESRKNSYVNVESAITNNPIWEYGTLDVQGIVKGDKFGKFSNGFTYLFKYLVKTVSTEKYPEMSFIETIGDSDNKHIRTLLYTHLGNKCFRTRDIVFGKAFKDRVGLLPAEKPDGISPWVRMRTIPAWVADFIEERKKINLDSGSGDG